MRFKLSTSFIEVNNTNNRVYSYFYFPLTVSSFKFSSQILSNSPFSLIPTLEKDSGFCSLSSFLLRTNHQLPVCISSHPHALPAPLELWKWLPLSSFFLSPLFSFSDGCFTPFKKVCCSSPRMGSDYFFLLSKRFSSLLLTLLHFLGFFCHFAFWVSSESDLASSVESSR